NVKVPEERATVSEFALAPSEVAQNASNVPMTCCDADVEMEDVQFVPPQPQPVPELAPIQPASLGIDMVPAPPLQWPPQLVTDQRYGLRQQHVTTGNHEFVFLFYS